MDNKKNNTKKDNFRTSLTIKDTPNSCILTAKERRRNKHTVEITGGDVKITITNVPEVT
jgi:hypothetical protein